MGRDEGAATVRQDQGEMEAAFPVAPSKDLEGSPLERVVCTGDGYATREPVEVVVGSVS